jgi:hypothetical protein
MRKCRPMPPVVRLLPAVVCLLVALASPAHGQGATNGAPEPVPAPAPRSADGRLLVTAVEVVGDIRLDGVLDEDAWRQATPVVGFVQAEPREGEPSTEDTMVRVLFDSSTLYVAAVCRDRRPGIGVVTQIREDFGNSDQDTFEVILDTFADRQNGFVFMTNRAGARADQQITNEGRQTNSTWDAVWHVATRDTGESWTVEMAIPFSSLRFEPEATDYWGINFSRRIRHNNEVAYWAPVPRAYTLARVSLAGNLEGLPQLPPGRNLQVKPYLLAQTVRGAEAGAAFDPGAALGVDLKYGVTPSLTLDATLNPDFAQVEADELTVNLTQFSTFYPEKREFFIENAGTFYVGDAPRNFRGSGGGGRFSASTGGPGRDTDLLLFHSRRIGLDDDGVPVDIFGGARLTGLAGGVELGLLSVQTRATGVLPNTNYTVMRARRAGATGSYVGGILMMRQSTDTTSDYNRTFGVDGNWRVGTADVNAYVVRTQTPGVDGGQYAAQTSFNQEGNFAHLKVTYLTIGEGFRNDLAFYRRTGMQKTSLETGVRPRPAWLRARGIREVHPHITWNYYMDLDGRMIGKRLHSGLSFSFERGGDVEVSVNPQYDEIDEPLELSPHAAPVPLGGYAWNEVAIRAGSDSSRRFSISGNFETGGLWSGSATSLSLTGTLRPTPQTLVSLGINRVDADLEIPGGEFVKTVWTLRANYSFTTSMYVDSLVQYDADLRRFNANIRFNFIHHPLSDLFVVYNEQQFRDDPGVPAGRSVIVKFTRMVAF